MVKNAGAEISVKERSCYAEWAIAEAKNLHGLSGTRYRGLEKVTIQGLMTAAVQNIRRLLAHNQRKSQKMKTSMTKLLNFGLYLLCEA